MLRDLAAMAPDHEDVGFADEVYATVAFYFYGISGTCAITFCPFEPHFEAAVIFDFGKGGVCVGPLLQRHD